ncbi:MAG: DNA-processing protein DprA [Anaerolineae bacterium]|nr:DNA-processing protein DprA [Anaerolineae bacterium]
MSELRYWVGFNLIPRIGPVRLASLLDYFGDLGSAWHASATALRAAGLPQDALEQLLYHRTRLDLDAELAKIAKLGLRVLTWESEGYPSLLKNIDHPPPVLYVRGEVLPSDEWAVAIVGTRLPTPYGKSVAQELARELAAQGITVVSGLALGIDGIAHRAALEAGGRTLAVLGCGLDIVYPRQHRRLAAQIVESGALLSDYPLGTKPEAGNFPPRNRIISGLSLGTVVVEAGERSGALITLHFALEQGRETFAVPGSIYSRQSAGTNAAIQRGEAKLVTCVQDILEELNISAVRQQQEMREVIPETPTEEALLAHLQRGEPVHIDELVRLSGMPTAVVSSTLALMELKGMVRRVENMSYVLAH